jgi:hypothetical protein
MSNGKRLRDWELERVHLGEAALETSCREDRWVQEQLNLLSQSDADILRDYPAEKVVHEVLKKMRRENPAHPAYLSWIRSQVASLWSELFQSRRWAFAASMGALALVVMTTSSVTYWNQVYSPDQVLTKGLKPFLIVYRKVGTHSEKLKASQRVKAKDLLQVSYVSSGASYGVIFSVDSLGGITLHLPESYGVAEKLNQTDEVILSNSFELDRAPGFERFYFITSSKSFDVKTVISEALRSKLDPKFNQFKIEFKK